MKKLLLIILCLCFSNVMVLGTNNDLNKIDVSNVGSTINIYKQLLGDLER